MFSYLIEKVAGWTVVIFALSALSCGDPASKQQSSNSEGGRPEQGSGNVETKPIDLAPEDPITAEDESLEPEAVETTSEEAQEIVSYQGVIKELLLENGCTANCHTGQAIHFGPKITNYSSLKPYFGSDKIQVGHYGLTWTPNRAELIQNWIDGGFLEDGQKIELPLLVPVDGASMITYREDLKPLFDLRCYSCHIHYRIPNFGVYSEVAAFYRHYRLKVGHAGEMWSAEEKKMIQDWIDYGKPP